MTSTEIARISRRLPPLGGLLDDTLDEAIRVRRRRVMVADNAALSLKALRVTDSSLDRLVQTAAMYGQEASHNLDGRVGLLTGAEKAAAVFVRIAVAVHMGETLLAELVATYINEFPRAVRDACWFYPVPNGPLSDNGNHVLDLFEKSGSSSAMRVLALELAGLRGEQRLSGQIRVLLDDPQFAAPASIALARMGESTSATQRFVEHCISSDERNDWETAMEIIACDPRLADDRLLQRALAADPATVDPIWAIALSREPRDIVEHAANRSDVPPGLRSRITAVAGYPADIIRACAEMAEVDGAVTPVNADILELVLGMVPVEARCEPNNKVDKSNALRSLVLRVFRGAHIALCNDADVDTWDVQAILANPAQAAKTRLRNGEVFPEGVPALGRALPEVSHSLRRWLYIERATLAQHHFSLSPFDCARRQDVAMMIGQFVDEMRAP